MKIAVIGAGLAGLAVTFFLSEKIQVDLFDEKGIGGGASGIACGLMHPYVGEEARRSARADEALACAAELASEAVISEGVVRIPRDAEEHSALQQTLLPYSDIEETSGAFLIKSGRTIDVPRYLKALWEKCAHQGAELKVQKVQNLHELNHYDQIIICAGAGTLNFFPELQVELLKGQLLVCQSTLALPRSLIGKGYVAKATEKGAYFLGSTYERNFTSIEPDLEVAKTLILPKIASFFPEASKCVIKECRAAVRVVRRGHYLPIVSKMDAKSWVFTALGSRGLLYHALYGKELATAVLENL